MDFLYWLQQQRTPLGESAFGMITHLGSDIILIAALCMMLWMFGRRAALRLAISYAGTGMLNQLVKIVFAVPRPWLLDDRLSPVESALPGASGYSFPSGHSQTATCLFTSIALYFKKRWLYIVSALSIAAVMLSRMYLGVHTLWDVSIGCALSLMLTIVISRLLTRAERSPNYIKYVCMGGLAGSVVMVAVIAFKASQGTPANMLSDITMVAGAALGFVCGLHMDARKPEIILPIRLSLPLSIAGIVIVMALKFVLGAVLNALPGVLWQTFVCYALIGLYITGVHPALMRALSGQRIASVNE